jgi:hypothetical protein
VDRNCDERLSSPSGRSDALAMTDAAPLVGQTEMKSFRDIKQALSTLQETCVILSRKLDELGLSQGAVNTNLCTVAEGQDKLIQSHTALAKQLEEIREQNIWMQGFLGGWQGRVDAQYKEMLHQFEVLSLHSGLVPDLGIRLSAIYKKLCEEKSLGKPSLRATRARKVRGRPDDRN